MNNLTMSTSRSKRVVFTAYLSLMFLACTPIENTVEQMDSSPARVTHRAASNKSTRLKQIPPAARQAIKKLTTGRKIEIRSKGGRVTKLAGELKIEGRTPKETFAKFMAKHGDILDVSQSNIETGQWNDENSKTIPLMYNKQRGTYRFTLSRHRQVQNGIPVFRSKIDILTENENNRIVSVAAQTRKLKKFVPKFDNQVACKANGTEILTKISKQVDYRTSAKSVAADSLSKFEKLQLIIWAGVNNEIHEPKLAIAYTASNGDRHNKPEKYLFVADAQTGEILYKENLIVHEDILGTVHAMATDGVGSPTCMPTTARPMSNALVSTNLGTTAYSNANGSFTIANEGDSQVQLTSPIWGQYFVVHDATTDRNEILTQTVTPPGPASFIHHETPNEYILAQSNAYVQSNMVRDWLLTYHPTYPRISQETQFPVHVNLSSYYCPGNAWYDNESLNFCAGGGTYPNAAFGSIIHHEYGHHIVFSGGSGQYEYGEGMADTIAMLIADDPGLGYGFTGDCSEPLRTGDNDCQYLASGCSTCGSQSHECGNLLSGIIWDIRNELVETEPELYRELLAALVINSVVLHTGTAINSDIAIDLLTLDDNDGNIGNGTPHRTEICTGFEAHGLSCPELEHGLAVLPPTGFDSMGDVGGPFSPGATSYTLENMGPDNINFGITSDVTWLSISNSAGALSVGERTTVDITVNQAADLLPKGEYEAQLSFVNETTHQGDRNLTITLVVGGPKAIYTWNLDENPGWSMDEGWEFGVPTGAGTDPISAATGLNILGYNLNGNYSNNISVRSLTTPAMNCSDLTEVSLRFQRWLGVETRNFDKAEVSISIDGNEFLPVWKNPYSTLRENNWSLQEIDLSAIADGQSTVYLRWTLGPTDSSVVLGGWNIDDIEIWATPQAPTPCGSNQECDDGLFCNGQEVCLEEGICQSGAPMDCADDVACTQDVCNESTNTCDHFPTDTLCNDGLFCNGQETCTLDGCEEGLAISCDDNISCTIDSCNEQTDACETVPTDSLCDDNTFCNGQETCGQQGCETGLKPCIVSVLCASAVCNEQSQSCDWKSDDSYCDNGQFCDGQEICDVALGCVSSQPPCQENCDEAYQTCSSCSDNLQNGSETDIDCGGTSCIGCPDEFNCEIDEDCLSEVCKNGNCQVVSIDATTQLVVTGDWGTGYCATLVVSNWVATTTTFWEVTLNLEGTQIYNQWNANFTGNYGEISLTPLSWNRAITGGQNNASVGFCANRNGSEGTATVVGTTAQY